MSTDKVVIAVEREKKRKENRTKRKKKGRKRTDEDDVKRTKGAKRISKERKHIYRSCIVKKLRVKDQRVYRQPP